MIAAICDPKSLNSRECKTPIMYSAYLSYAQIREYMPTLIESDLLRTTNDGQSPNKIRERGLRFLELYDKLNEMIGTEKKSWIYQ